MNPLIKKLQYKGQKNIQVLNSPHSFQPVLEELMSLTEAPALNKDVADLDFVMVFATKKHELEQFVHNIAPKLRGDAILWMCYPKGSSKKYTCDFNRDTGWEVMKKYDLTAVSQVAIDQDWSALRFRKLQFIKQLTRIFDNG